jgi:hypothetical protein
MPNVPYGENIAKWGELARAIRQQAALVKLFENDGIKDSEIRDIDTTEQEAEAADRLQLDATQALQGITKDLIIEKDVVIALFGELKRKAANAISDLEEANQASAAQTLKDIDFSSAAIPKIKGQPQDEEENEETVKAGAPEGNAPSEEGEEEEVESPTAQRESKSQKAIALAARRVANHLETKDTVLKALYERKMPTDFLKTLKEKSERIVQLRNDKALALANQKSATKAEHDATQRHIKARGKVEPTATTLAKKNAALKALMVLHLNRKS